MNRDFTIQKYLQLCKAIKLSGFQIYTTKTYLEKGTPSGPFIVLRHDVDRNLRRALRMAYLENYLGIQASYYVRKGKRGFCIPFIKKIEKMGHEIGYHYDAMVKAKGDMEKAIRIFYSELKELRNLVNVKTISMHGSPLSPWNNLKLWERYDFRDFDLLGDIFLSIDYRKAYYFTDTGRNWSSNKYFNIRDRINSCTPGKRIKTTNELINFIENVRKEKSIFINVHPNRWAFYLSEWIMNYLFDLLINQAKLLIFIMEKIGLYRIH